jgi:adenylosuccinate lyase
VKLYGLENDLTERIRSDEEFGLTDPELEALLDPASFTGLAERQCETFLREEIRPLLEKNRDCIGAAAEIRV